MVPWVGLQCVIVGFPDHTHFLVKKVANHMVSMIGFMDFLNQCPDITGKENCSLLLY